MAKKQISFAEKATRAKDKIDNKYVKYIKSVRSEKTGKWRFNEQIITLQGNETLDAALKRMDEARLALDINMPEFSDEDRSEAAESAKPEQEDGTMTESTEEKEPAAGENEPVSVEETPKEEVTAEKNPQ